MIEDYERIAKLGDGAQGKVFHVRHKKTGREYALKLIRCRDQAQANLALKEIKVLIQLRHPGIVSYTDFFLDFDSRRPNEILVCLVMELCLGNDMEGLVKDEVNNFMRTGKNGTTEATALSWIAQAAEALGYLHGRGYLHRDIKPTNIFFATSSPSPLTATTRDGSPSPSQPSQIKLGDFGLATSMGVDLLNSMVGTPLYIAPELLLKKKYDFKVDVWGLGVVILEVLTLQERPINSEVLESEKSVDGVVKDIRRMGYSSGLANLVRDMLQKDPAKRPTPIEILERVNSLNASSGGRRSTSTTGEDIRTANTTPASSRPSSASSQDPDAQQMQNSHRRPSALQTVSVEVLKHSPTHWDNVDTPAFAATMSTNTFGEEMLPAASINVAAPGSIITCQMCEERVASIICEDCDNEHYCADCDALRHRNVKRAAHRRMPIPSSKPPTPTQTLPPTTTMVKPTSTSLRSQLVELMKPVTVTIPSQAPNLSSALQLLRTLRNERNKQLSICRKQLADTSLCSDVGGVDVSMAVDASPSTLDRILVGCSVREDKPVYVDTPVEITSITTSTASSASTGKVLVGGSGSGGGLLVDDDGGLSPSTTSIAQTIEVNAKEGLILLCKDSESDNYQQTGHIHNINIVQRWDGDATPPSSTSAAGDRAPSSSSSTGMRFAAVDVRGGTWLVEKCRINSQGGQGVILDGIDCFATIRDCAILQTKGAGIYAAACASGGTILRNRIVGCGSGILVRGSRTGRTLSIQSNHILQSSETGVFCHEASPTLIDNTISESGACGIVLKGKDCNPSLKSNTVSHSKHAGIFVCDGASGDIKSNFINSSGKSGIMLKAAANPLVGGNRIQQGAETGIYISEKSLGRYEKNHVLDNGNAGLLVTTGAVPVVVSNIISGNRYEGIWVSALGSGRYEKNDLRRNRKGAKDIEQGCSVVFNDNIEK